VSTEHEDIEYSPVPRELPDPALPLPEALCAWADFLRRWARETPENCRRQPTAPPDTTLYGYEIRAALRWLLRFDVVIDRAANHPGLTQRLTELQKSLRDELTALDAEISREFALAAKQRLGFPPMLPPLRFAGAQCESFFRDFVPRVADRLSALAEAVIPSNGRDTAPPPAPGAGPQEYSPTTALSVGDIAQHYDIPPEKVPAFRKRLERLRSQDSTCFTEVQNATNRAPRYLYLPGHPRVRQAIQQSQAPAP